MISEYLQFHHLGLAASDPARAVTFLTALGYTVGDEISDPLQNVILRMCTHRDSPDVEVISRTDSPGPLDSILRDSNHLIYHTCWVTPKLSKALEAFVRKGIRCTCVSEPTPAVLFDHDPVSFYMVRGFGLIEILERRA